MKTYTLELTEEEALILSALSKIGICFATELSGTTLDITGMSVAHSFAAGMDASELQRESYKTLSAKMHEMADVFQESNPNPNLN